MQALDFDYNNLMHGGLFMIRLRILDILEEQNHTKYWLYKQMDLSYQNFNRIVNNETTSIRFDNLEKLCTILQCSLDELFEITNEENLEEIR